MVAPIAEPPFRSDAPAPPRRPAPPLLRLVAEPEEPFVIRVLQWLGRFLDGGSGGSCRVCGAPTGQYAESDYHWAGWGSLVFYHCQVCGCEWREGGYFDWK